MREFTAMTQNKNGGTEAVTISAANAADAEAKLLKLGYHKIIWIL